MSMLNDPEMKEVVLSFCEESLDIFSELEELLEEFEDDISKIANLEKFGQLIDRVMGAAKSLEANKVGKYCELGKIISYKASQTMDVKLLQIVTAVLFDTVEILESIINNIKTKQIETSSVNLDAFSTRLKWLADKFQNIDRASVAIGEEAPISDQKSIDELLKDLGL